MPRKLRCTQYSNAYLRDRARKVLEDCGANLVVIHLDKKTKREVRRVEREVQLYIMSLERVYKWSREHPVWLGVSPDPGKKKAKKKSSHKKGGNQ